MGAVSVSPSSDSHSVVSQFTFVFNSAQCQETRKETKVRAETEMIVTEIHGDTREKGAGAEMRVAEGEDTGVETIEGADGDIPHLHPAVQTQIPTTPGNLTKSQKQVK